MKEKQEKDEQISFALRERSTMSANWTGTKAVPRATSIESQLSVDAEPLSLNLTACSEDCIASVQEGSGQTGRQQSEPKGIYRSSNDETTHLHKNMTYPGASGLPEDHHGIDNNAFSLTSPQSTSSLQEDWETKLKEYEKDLSDIEHDVMVLYSEDDIKAVEIFKNHLEKDIILPDKRRVDVVLYDEFRLSGLSFENLDRAFDKCSFTFVFLTKSFVENTWCKITSESCLMKTIHCNKQKGWRVVPVYTKRLAESDFCVPMGLNALKGVNYYNNDEYYRKGVARMILENRKKVEQAKQQRLEIQNYRRPPNIASQKEESSTIKCTECSTNTECTFELEDYRQSNAYFNRQMQPDTIELVDGATEKCDNISREDNGQAVHCSYQKVLLQENADTQENIKQQTPDNGKRSQSIDLSAMEVDTTSARSGTVREKPIAVVRPGNQTTSLTFSYSHKWHYCLVHGRHYKVLELLHKNTTVIATSEGCDMNTVD